MYNPKKTKQGSIRIQPLSKQHVYFIYRQDFYLSCVKSVHAIIAFEINDKEIHYKHGTCCSGKIRHEVALFVVHLRVLMKEPNICQVKTENAKSNDGVFQGRMLNLQIQKETQKEIQEYGKKHVFLLYLWSNTKQGGDLPLGVHLCRLNKRGSISEITLNAIRLRTRPRPGRKA